MSDSTQLADSFLFDSTTNPNTVVSVSKDKRVVNVVDSGTVIINATSKLNGSTGYGSLRDAYVVVPYVVTVVCYKYITDSITRKSHHMCLDTVYHYFSWYPELLVVPNPLNQSIHCYGRKLNRLRLSLVEVI